MRLLINASVTGVIVNGFSVYCRELLRELLPLLEERGHDVELLIRVLTKERWQTTKKALW